MIASKSHQEISKLLKKLVYRKVVTQIKSSVFVTLRTGQESAQLTNWPIIARALAEPKEYYISHYSAMRIHEMTSHPLLCVYITLTKQMKKNFA